MRGHGYQSLLYSIPCDECDIGSSCERPVVSAMTLPFKSQSEGSLLVITIYMNADKEDRHNRRLQKSRILR